MSYFQNYFDNINLMAMDTFLVEGIDIDDKNKIVKFNSSHENNIDTSTIINPTYHTINGYEVISIFQRKKNDKRTDGGPLIYALKGQNGWTIDSKSILSIIKNAIKVTHKLHRSYDTIIKIPSTSNLNRQMMDILVKHISHQTSIYKFFAKLSASEVFAKYTDFKNFTDDDFKKASNQFQKMIDENNNIFSFKFLSKDYRRCVTKAFIKNEIDPNLINGKSILIIDDTITSGSSFTMAANELIQAFDPKKITLISLFSPLEQ